MSIDEQYMMRCLQLAQLGAGKVAPNPMVGAVLVYENKIIGEGYHQQYGGPHAEVNCINSVKEENRKLIALSVLYVSLEPCSHFGKTPPCSDLIIKNKIPKVIIGCQDIYKEVSGSGILQLQNAGVDVVTGVLKDECIKLNKRFFTFHQKCRPYIILKWAQSVNGIIGDKTKRILITNEYTNRVVHKWRSEESAILVGTNTAFQDDPLLTARLWEGTNPLRIVIDKKLKLPSSLNIFNKEAKTIVFNNIKDEIKENLVFIKLSTEDFFSQIMKSLFEMNIQSVIIEGGSITLQSFIKAGLWDEARVITNEALTIENGIASPPMKDFILEKQERYLSDIISYYVRDARKPN